MSSPHFLNPEDLHNAASPSSAFEDDGHFLSATPASVIVHSKPAKKRKSWGQSLPEPTTALPPRKRAKTDDEKEQRRIERIKRNRAAAHNSRERKRAETETLAVALARANAELNAYRSIHGPLPSHVVLPEVTLINTDPVDTPAHSLIESHGTYDPPTPDSSPEDDLDLDLSFDSVKQEPTDNLAPYLPPAIENLDVKLLDPMHPAAMPDLQCRSSRASTTSTSRKFNNTWWATLFLHLMTLQLRTTYKTLLLGVWTLSPSRMARLMQASALRLTSRSTTSSTAPLLLRSTALAQLNAATSRPTQQGALRALQRSVSEETRTRVRAATAMQGSCAYQRQALGDQARDGTEEGTGDDDVDV
ncbi:transcription factor that binds to CRE motif [Friedmanniomyces endolithicus]|nr:transcription factor that binds to CRE motif [Friedmanniomyces endolithicus]KAK0793640.1 transcription factor that binds to CRE motif [Friedmanniomyces endolithicus]KAK0796878.1 transcription factor that binds to CRE motif [Friedmanniomyces endolithicus]KAK0807802.1 transcription factor that binds to CRE motif [Friedmanniomyces endolithicus]KAK0838592.1 transcription factor that binds to CRE motif [Friedmanniomyces endolithicus]